MLDRGQDKDWFSTREIIIEAVLAGLGLYLFVVHMLTAEKPFIAPAVFRDRNFVSAAVMVFCTGMLLLATSALLAPFLQTLAGYPVATAGIALAPRGLGTMAAMLVASRLGMKVDQRKLMAAGLLLLGWTLHAMSFWTPDVSQRQMMGTLLAQGVSMGLIFNPMTVMAFTTLPPQFRGDATAMQSLSRNIGAAIGVSVTSFMLARSIQVSHADLAARITPFTRPLQHHGAMSLMVDPTTKAGAALLDQVINRQAEIIAYNNDFHLMSFVVIPPLLLLLLMRRHQRADGKVRA
jgi:MFS transporter, DHA2 family, multidrug resistance protein